MKYLGEIIKGMLIGIANIIPGVSGGTMAVSMNIYDKIIFSVTHIFKDFKTSVKTLLPYGIGMVLGILGLSFIIEYFFNQYPVQTNFIFIGMIIGGLPVICNELNFKSNLKPMNIVLFLLFFGFIIAMGFLGEGSGDVEIKIGFIQILILFAIGIIASATMVVPGVSGSMILMLLGYYRPIIETVNSTVKALAAFNIEGIIGGICVLAPFGMGIIAGIFLISKIIEFLLNNFKVSTYFAIFGLVIASPISLVMGIDFSSVSFIGMAAAILLLVIGFLIPYKILSKL